MNELFEEYGFEPQITRSLQEQNITTPTQIQREVIPLALAGGDVVAKAPTGTGKTLAFALPMLSKIDRDDNAVQAAIVCPTRELVIQTCEVIQGLLKYVEGIRVAGIYGGQNIQKQLFCLRKKPQIIVGTPGRMLDHIDRRTLKLAGVKYMVLDEGDEMLDMGFRGDIEKISACAGECQRLCFSATLPVNISQLVESLFVDPTYVKVATDGENTPKIRQYYSMVKDAQRVGAMLKIIDENAYELVIAFCNTKIRADRLFKALDARGRSAAVIHGDMRQNDRTQIFKRFKAKQLNVLVATDVAARGLDVDGVDAIINFDPPAESDFYVHRIGRTARAKKDGAAYTLIDSSQVGYIPSFQKVSGNALEFLELDNIADSYTLPKDSSNKIKGFYDNQSRFFLNVGKRDLLDKESLSKLIVSSTALKEYEISDLKIRDNYSFVSVLKGCEAKLLKLKGVVLGKRTVTVQQAKEEDKRVDGADKKTSIGSASASKRGKSIEKGGKSRSGKPVGGSGKIGRSEGKKRGKSDRKPLSRKAKFVRDYEDELHFSYRQTDKKSKK